MVARRRRALAVVAVSAAALAGLWRLLPAGSPPLYDGICIADPYRPLGQSPAPSSASKTYPAGEFPTSEVITGENPAQAQLLMMMGTLPTSSAAATVTITPVAIPAPPPSGLRLDGNVYRMQAMDASGRVLQPAAQEPVTVVLRGTGSAGELTMYAYSGTAWHGLQTFNAGCGYEFEAVSTTLGDFGLFAQGAGPPPAPGGGGGFPVAVLVGVIVVVAIAAAIGLARLNARRAR